ncbi:hypothetical protein ACFVVX_12865 [Kitasatospora sp. NPDC058170]|uniref:hypothetical protein n=1 Tax=Kitasatospora sp. NPDC058170 TaxID=3346364 RepID=UPI0036DBB61B
MSTLKRDAAAYRPCVGELVLDRRTGRTGIYMDTIGGERYLRPPAGGCEWTARPEHLGPAPTPAEDGPDPAAARALPGARPPARGHDPRLDGSRVA